ncbi:MAG: PIN domain-containing protein [Chloroflexales bacterium]|nr:PIN domain-containing protein [Chloroflexales bacterium]
MSDTHAIHWHLAGNPKLSTTTRQIFHAADAGTHQIIIPAIVLVEFIYLAEKGRLDRARVDQLSTLLATPGGSYAISPLDADIASALWRVPRALVPEMPDRIITATALALGLPLITRDGAIQRSGLVPTIWNQAIP